jgi:hypothetical protein
VTIIEKYDLTFGEVWQLLAAEAAEWAKIMIRTERGTQDDVGVALLPYLNRMEAGSCGDDK